MKLIILFILIALMSGCTNRSYDENKGTIKHHCDLEDRIVELERRLGI